MKILTVIDMKLMGDMDPKYGQAYWGTVEEQDMPVKFNLMQQLDILPGRKIMAQEYTIKESAKGTEYMQLKKVKVSDQTAAFDTSEGSTPTSTSVSTSDETPSYEAGTNARWALKLAVDTHKAVLGRVPEDETDYGMIEDFAGWLLDAFGRLKNRGSQEGLGSHGPDLQPIKAEDSPATGYDKAKAVRASMEEEDYEG
jgi:hypothetical protein